MKQVNWWKIAVCGLLVIVNIGGAFGAFYYSFLATLILNIDLVERDYNAPLPEKLNAIFKTSILLTLMLIVFAGFIAIINYTVLQGLKFSDDRAKKWTFALACLYVVGVLTTFCGFLWLMFREI